MKIENNEVTFSTGKTRYANRGIIGLGPDMEVSQGYDGIFYSGEDEELYRDSADLLSNTDLIELADYMIEQWKTFRSLHET